MSGAFYNSALELVNNPDGFSIVDCSYLTDVATRSVLAHLALTIGAQCMSLEELVEDLTGRYFGRVKEKKSRMLPPELTKPIINEVIQLRVLRENLMDYVTDEECLGYPNIYCRVVRANSPTDVGPIHADRWFWDLGNGYVPSTHARLKVWVPLLQNDSEPGLLILPGSHRRDYTYGTIVDSTGKRKPVFADQITANLMVPAPVSVGQAIVFNDSLLHGGRATGTSRISIEFTVACNLCSQSQPR